MDSFPVFFFYESIFLIVFPFRNVTLIQFSLESRIGRGGFITSSKVDINVLELWVRLFLNGRGGRIRLRLRPSRRFVRRNHRPLKISRNRHAFNPSSNGQPLPRTQLKLPIISERILNYLAFETSDSSFVFHVDSWTILYHRTSRNWYQRNIFKSSDDFTLRSSFSSTSKKKKKRNVSLPNRLARNFSNIIQQPNEGFFEGGVGGVESLVQPRTRHASRDFSFLNEKEIRDSHRLSIIHPRAFTMQTRDGVRGRPDEKLEQARLVPSQRYRRNVVQGGVTTLHHHRRESTVLLLLLPLP